MFTIEGSDVYTGKAYTDEPNDEPEVDEWICDLPTDDGIGSQYGLSERPGGIGVDSRFRLEVSSQNSNFGVILLFLI